MQKEYPICKLVESYELTIHKTVGNVKRTESGMSRLRYRRNHKKKTSPRLCRTMQMMVKHERILSSYQTASKMEQELGYKISHQPFPNRTLGKRSFHRSYVSQNSIFKTKKRSLTCTTIRQLMIGKE